MSIPIVEQARNLEFNPDNVRLNNSIAIMGNDGTGKTTVAKLLQSMFPQLQHCERMINYSPEEHPDKETMKARQIGMMSEHGISNTPKYVEGFLTAAIEDLQRPLDTTPKLVEGIWGTKAYATIAESLYKSQQANDGNEEYFTELLGIAEHVIKQYGVFENAFYLDLPQEKINERIAKRAAEGTQRMGHFDKKALSPTFPVYIAAMHKAFEMIGAKRINADDTPENIAAQIARLSMPNMTLEKGKKLQLAGDTTIGVAVETLQKEATRGTPGLRKGTEISPN